ncbi:Hypothetical predicted protein, partial [Scomber scombrus]
MAQPVFNLCQSDNRHCPGHEATVHAWILRKPLPQVFEAKAQRTHVMTIFRLQRSQTGQARVATKHGDNPFFNQRKQMLGEGANAQPSPTGVPQTNTVSLSENTSANYKANSTRLRWEREREHCLHQQ